MKRTKKKTKKQLETEETIDMAAQLDTAITTRTDITRCLSEIPNPQNSPKFYTFSL